MSSLKYYLMVLVDYMNSRTEEFVLWLYVTTELIR